MSGSLFRSTTRKRSRRTALSSLCAALFAARNSSAQILQDDQSPDGHKLKFPDTNDDPRLPDGKSQKNAIAKQQHEQALKDADDLVEAAEDLRKQLRQAGTFVMPLSSVKKTEEIEKIAKRIRGRLKS